jgi:hypothetical protein
MLSFRVEVHSDVSFHTAARTLLRAQSVSVKEILLLDCPSICLFKQKPMKKDRCIANQEPMLSYAEHEVLSEYY